MDQYKIKVLEKMQKVKALWELLNSGYRFGWSTLKECLNKEFHLRIWKTGCLELEILKTMELSKRWKFLKDAIRGQLWGKLKPTPKCNVLLMMMTTNLKHLLKKLFSCLLKSCYCCLRKVCTKLFSQEIII